MADRHNTEYVLTVSAPLVRPGFTITSGPVSERYVVETANRLMKLVREINGREKTSTVEERS